MVEGSFGLDASGLLTRLRVEFYVQLLDWITRCYGASVTKSGYLTDLAGVSPQSWERSPVLRDDCEFGGRRHLPGIAIHFRNPIESRKAGIPALGANTPVPSMIGIGHGLEDH